MSQTIKAKIEELRKRRDEIVARPASSKSLIDIADMCAVHRDAASLLLSDEMTAALDAAEKMPVTLNLLRRLRRDLEDEVRHGKMSSALRRNIEDVDEFIASLKTAPPAAPLDAEAALAGDGEGKGETR